MQARQSTERLHISTSFFQTGYPPKFCHEITGNSIVQSQIRDGVTCVVLLCSVLLAHCLYSSGFGTATLSLNIF